MARQTLCGHLLDVRENVKFKGGYFSSWIHQEYPRHACVLAVEFRKTFMNEWTGIPDWPRLGALRDILKKALPAVTRSFQRS